MSTVVVAACVHLKPTDGGWPPSKWSLGEVGMHHHHVIGQGWSLEWSSLDKSSLVGTIGVGYVGLGLLMMAHHRHR